MNSPPLGILLIDDDATINLLNKMVIDMSPVEAVVADHTNAETALAEITEGKLSPKLILLDINMPEMDGWEFADAYEQLPADTRTSRVVVLSSSINPRDRERADSHAVIDGFYSKPLTVQSIKEIAQKFFN